MRSGPKFVLVVLAALIAFPTIALADDWTASRLFGRVLQLVDGQWQPLQRGDVVPDGRVIRTAGLGRATFTRGAETVDVGFDTQIQIFDKGTGRPFTTVKQYFGTVAVEAEVENVQHFAVQTPYLAAVVKGTRFTVKSGKTGASVAVQRGHVAVEDAHDHSHVLISVGQSAAIDNNKSHGALLVSGGGTLPTVLSSTGKPLDISHDTGSGSSKGKSNSSDDSSGKGSSNSGGSNDNSGKGSGSSGSGNSGNGNSGKTGDHSGKGSGKDDDGSDD